MARFLLVHGTAHGAWCWRDVIPALKARGHAAHAIDLPGHGQDATPYAGITLDDYAHAVLDGLRDHEGPSLVVGHSMGGFPITRAAEIDPSRIARLVYLCAHTPWPGQSLSEMRLLGATQPLLPVIRKTVDGKGFTLDPEQVEAVFYHDCPADTVALAQAQLCTEPLAPSATPVDLSDRSATLPRSYILCRRDRAVPPDLQETLAARFDPADVHALDSGHSPFFSMPDRLAELLDRIAAQT
ncbi:alpha/beta fold hydrolase [Pseudoponticoccus marisrubri]|uniref:Esterase n=1 Tax=Pseudoponticoccus marisrubri TaxID=1685382 RepID=A0A0W7WGA4_9RHOB|nr:alpha/beta fold hydrolase [Pseudoponticoccus marisrubri]KUF09660.1 esterase [Pseudoponticoccus marisrubri]